MRSHVLLVDDDEEHSAMLSTTLAQSGYRTTVVTNGRSALTTLEQERFHLVLLDLEMPGLDGLNVLRSIRKVRSEADVPVIVVSGHGESNVIATALKTGANDYIVKPVDLTVALARIERQLTRCQGERRLSNGNKTLAKELCLRRLAAQRLNEESLHDPLTRFHNLRSFTESLQAAVDRTNHTGEGAIAVLFVDVDRMKQVNDSLGFEMGDRLLMAIAERLRAAVRAQDSVARVGGDEFAVLITDMPVARAAVQLAERLLAEMRAPFRIGDLELVITMTIGVALSVSRTASGDDLLTAAAAANHEGKSEGRDCWVLFDKTMRTRAQHAVRIESDLRRALTSGELVVVYEPVVSLASETLAGFEALVRWNHPTRGVVAPRDFIPIAEATGLIASIDRWVIAEAAQCMRQWHDRLDNCDLTVSVNLSARALTESGFTGYVDSVLRTSGLTPNALKLELTESTLVNHPGAASGVMQRLRDCGVHLSLDDFGTGCSSFNYLKQFPFDTLKIDRSFVQGSPTSDKDKEIVRMITTVSHRFGMEVVAEGIESEAQLSCLRDLECDYGQGWIFAKPQNSKAAERLATAGGRWPLSDTDGQTLET